jgi:methyltransferase family protein
MPELLIGCGNSRIKALAPIGAPMEWSDLTTLDFDPNSGADVEWDLERLPLPFKDEYYDEIHAYHVLEHTGRQGDYRFFFAQFSDFWRILKPGGILFGMVPAPGGVWVFGDPGHTRVISMENFTFLDQAQYTEQVGKTALADYRHIYRADFSVVYGNVHGDHLCFGLTAIKPSRISI